MKTSSKVAAAVAAASIALTGVAIAPANAADGTTSLATVLDIGNAAFDSNSGDFDVLTAAINAVLAAKPNSAVAVLADGNTTLTAFIPTDGAFKKLARQLGKSNKDLRTEAQVFAAVASIGIDNVEKTLLHHVVVASVPFATALGANGAVLDSAAGQKITVKVDTSITLMGSTGFFQPKVNLRAVDINAGNKQIAHAINNVMVPDLTK